MYHLAHSVDRVLCFFSSRPNWDPPPTLRRMCSLPLLFRGGGRYTLARGRGGGGPNSDRGKTLWYSVLCDLASTTAICTLVWGFFHAFLCYICGNFFFSFFSATCLVFVRPVGQLRRVYRKTSSSSSANAALWPYFGGFLAPAPQRRRLV
jgi:hypothetical protein